MDALTLSAAAAAVSVDLRGLTKKVAEYLQDPDLLGDPELESATELILDRLCLSTQLAKPVGLATWAIRQARRIGVRRTLDLADAAAYVIANEATRFSIDHARLLAFLDVLRKEITSALAALGAEPVQAAPAYAEAAQALLAMLGERDAGTCAHSKATGEWARRLAVSMRLPREQIDLIELCGALHDVGKIAMPDAILLKPAPLTEQEWEVVRDHSAAGQRILNQIPSLARCGIIIRAHHERWDGLGYPDGLAGESTPFEARVVAVVDAFHAMISDRPYRRAMAPRRALQTLEEGAGTQWDALIVGAMLDLFSIARPQRKHGALST